jgi:maleylpyruvate isomerase
MSGLRPTRELDWMERGHRYFMSCLAGVDDARLSAPTTLPGWSGRHLLAHVGHNARALGRLAHWAATGEKTPMYPSPTARNSEIEAGADWAPHRLREFVVSEQDRLAAALGRLTEEQWQAEVVTAQGRTVPAIAIPWLRSRELWIHACDLPSTGDFADLPADFLDALIDDAASRRRSAQSIDLPAVLGSPADLARWLTGRGRSRRLRTADGTAPPDLPPWL